MSNLVTTTIHSCNHCNRELVDDQTCDCLPDVFISVYMPVAGWKPIMYAVDNECGGEHTPHGTGSFAYTQKSVAIMVAKQWAKDEELPFIDTCPEKTDDAPRESVRDQIAKALRITK